MPIRWKVVTKERLSIVISRTSFGLYYPKGEKVKAHKDSIGIAVFKTKEQAERWSFLNCRPGTKVLKVNALGKGINPKVGMPAIWGDYDFRSTIRQIQMMGIKKVLAQTNGWHSPKGTLLYRAVEVLE